MTTASDIPDDEGGVRPAESEGVRKERIERTLNGFRRYPKLCGILVRMLEVDVAGDEAALHHEEGIDDLAGAGHPHLVAGLALGGRHGYGALAEHAGDGLRLVRVAYMGGCRMGIDIADFAQVDAGAPDGHLQRAGGTVHVGGGDVVAVRGEAVAEDLGEDGRAAADGRFVAFEDDGRGAAARHEAVAVAVEGPAGLLRRILPDGERGNAVE